LRKQRSKPRFTHRAVAALVGIAAGLAEVGGFALPAKAAPLNVAEQFALHQIGKPYAWGASGLGAYDCSGLTYRAWQAAGVHLPRTAEDQYWAGVHVPLPRLQPGDLVFWGRGTGDIYHVGMYVGAGRVVNATRPGGSVTVMGMYALGSPLPLGVKP
jgi:cell wall-associated NlpC family hydrolase